MFTSIEIIRDFHIESAMCPDCNSRLVHGDDSYCLMHSHILTAVINFVVRSFEIADETIIIPQSLLGWNDKIYLTYLEELHVDGMPLLVPVDRIEESNTNAFDLLDEIIEAKRLFVLKKSC